MLVGLSGYLAGYNGSFSFESGQHYPPEVDYVKMRMFNAMFNFLCVPAAYFTAKELHLSLPAVWLLTLCVLFENSYVTLGRLILLDSMLLLFTVTTFFAFVKFHNHQDRPFSRKWWKWLLLTGISIGCVTSVKMVGLFITSLVGLYTAIDLWNKFADKSISIKTYIAHWVSRIFGLIVVPIFIFALCFKVHFDLLYHSGPGDATMNSLFQANLVGSDITSGARDVVFGSVVTIKNQASGTGLLHSHVQTYPDGSKQNQVTTYGHKDSNNQWIFEHERGVDFYTVNEPLTPISDKAVVRFTHQNTGRNLHTHDIAAPVSKAEQEVSGYGNLTIGDEKDNWIIEIVSNIGDEDSSILHPLTSAFRIKSAVYNCYLATSGSQLPQWGFRQGEVVCKKNPFKRDKSTWWNIELHENDRLEAGEIKLPKTSFIKDFIELNLAMMMTNNALVPDPEKQDDLASAFWQWPTLNVGIRLCGWSDENVKYFLLGSPAVTWLSSIFLIVFVITTLTYILRWKRQYNDFADSQKLDKFLMGGVYPFIGWVLHFLPFVIMARITYVHHYLPALYFAMIIFSFTVDFFTSGMVCTKTCKAVRLSIFAILYTLIIGVFVYFAPISFGMTGPASQYAYLNWFSTWRVIDP